MLDNEETDKKKKKELAFEQNLWTQTTIKTDIKPVELLMCLSFGLENRLSYASLVNLLKYTNCVFGDKILPETRYFINKLSNTENNITFHGVCMVCSQYLGTFIGLIQSIHCSECKSKIHVSNPSNAIRGYLENHSKYYDYVIRNRVHESGKLFDIYDGF